jgi:gamma-glutamyltranspeptidase/glutathione hydrolase
MRQGGLPFASLPNADHGHHSAAVVAVDQWGNVAALVQSINSLWWGETGIFVDGVSVGDPASFQQEAMALVGPGQRLPDPTNPLIVLRDGQPVLASSCVGQVHVETVQRLANVLDHGLDPKEALDAPAFLAADVTVAADGTWAFTGQVIEGDFDAEITEGLRAMGQRVNELPPRLRDLAEERGWWIGVTLDPHTDTLSGATERTFGGAALGY